MIGDSMDNGKSGNIRNGDLLTAVRIAVNNTFALQGIGPMQIYVFKTRWGLMVKEVIRIEENSVFCSSQNSDKAMYPDFELNFTDGYSIYAITSLHRLLAD
jgi:hypothetical protein